MDGLGCGAAKTKVPPYSSIISSFSARSAQDTHVSIGDRTRGELTRELESEPTLESVGTVEVREEMKLPENTSVSSSESTKSAQHTLDRRTREV
jgi:hypothetical protein